MAVTKGLLHRPIHFRPFTTHRRQTLLRTFTALAKLLVTTAAITVASLGCAYAQAPVTKIPINIGLAAAMDWPGYVARDMKILEQVGFEPKYYIFNAGGPMIAGIKSGDLDIAATGLATLFMVGQGVPIKYILTKMDLGSTVNYVVNPASGIQSYKDIAKSKSIGTTTATCGEISLVRAAKAAGTDRSKLKVSNLAPNLLLGAMKEQQIDSAFVWAPWTYALRDAGMKLLSDDTEYSEVGGVCIFAVAARPAFLEKYPQAGCLLVKAHMMSVEAGRKDPTRAAGTLSSLLGVSEKIAMESFKAVDKSMVTMAAHLDPKSPFSMTNTKSGLTEKLYVAGESLYEAKAFAKPISRETIAATMEPKYVQEYVETNCNKR